MTIPIVQRTPAHEDLVVLGYPMVIVDKWSEISQKRMDQWWDELSPRLEQARWMLLAEMWSAFVLHPCPGSIQSFVQAVQAGECPQSGGARCTMDNKPEPGTAKRTPSKAKVVSHEVPRWRSAQRSGTAEQPALVRKGTNPEAPRRGLVSSRADHLGMQLEGVPRSPADGPFLPAIEIAPARAPALSNVVSSPPKEQDDEWQLTPPPITLAHLRIRILATALLCICTVTLATEFVLWWLREYMSAIV